MSRDVERMPPQCVEMEQAVVGAMLVDKWAIGVVPAIISESDFYEARHALIYRAILDVHEFDGEVDQLTVAKYLKDRNELTEVGGVSYIAKLASEVATARNAALHARAILDTAQKREVIQASHAAIESAFTSQASGVSLSENFASKLLTVSSRGAARDFGSMQDVMRDVNDELVRATASKRLVAGLDSGFWSINNYLNGFCKSELTIIAARPSIGKSTLARQIAVEICKREKTGVGIFSVEMSRRQIGQCLACSLSGISLAKLRRGQLDAAQSQRFMHASQQLSRLPIYVDDTPALTIPQMRSAMQRHSQQHEIGLWVVDYLQLMTGEGRSKNDEIGSISKALKQLAREFDVPVVALSQLSRQVEARPDKRPQLSDLRESGSLEQDADNVVLIYRPAFYEVLCRRARSQGREKEALLKKRVELIFPKTRFGPTGKQTMEWDAERALFRNPQGNAVDADELEELVAEDDELEELQF
jgi:replicative DNA helicase